MLTRLFLFAITAATFLFTNSAFSQANQEKIQGTWTVKKFEPQQAGRDIEKIEAELKQTRLRFEKTEVVITKTEECTDRSIKSGPYNVRGDQITIGQDKAQILLLNEKEMQIKIPGQGILYFARI